MSRKSNNSHFLINFLMLSFLLTLVALPATTFSWLEFTQKQEIQTLNVLPASDVNNLVIEVTETTESTEASESFE